MLELVPVWPKLQVTFAAFQLIVFTAFLIAVTSFLVTALVDTAGLDTIVIIALLAGLWGTLFWGSIPRMHAYAGSERLVLDRHVFQQRRRFFGLALPARRCSSDELEKLEVRRLGVFSRYLKPTLIIRGRRRTLRVGGGLSYEQALALAQQLRAGVSIGSTRPG